MSAKIYICTHTDFEPVVTNQIYEVLDSRLLGNDTTKEGLPGSFYSELYNYRYVAEHYELPDYIGFCGYRKYFSFFDDISEERIKELVDKHGCICGELADFKTMTVR